MPKVEQYEAVVKIVVELRAEGRSVASYSATRTAVGPSLTENGKENLMPVLGKALADTLAAHSALAAGVQNAERRRLK